LTEASKKVEMWFTERQTPHLAISLRVKETLARETTPYQELAIMETYEFGTLLTLDGIVQTTVKDEFIYHEQMTHVPLHTHPEPKTVLVIGGGDGGIVREALKHPSVEKVVLVDIDERVIEACKKHLPTISCALDDPRVEVRIEDGIKFVKKARNAFDVIIIDSTDPVGPAVGLFTADFYRSALEALTEEGVVVAQTESPLLNPDMVKRVFETFAGIFPIARVYTAEVPTYPGAIWAITLGSKVHDPMDLPAERFRDIETRFYTPWVHMRSFALPRFVEELVQEQRPRFGVR